MTYARQLLGRQGESMACAELERLGYTIVERRFRTRFGEIDVVANDRGTVVFVEVKAPPLDMQATLGLADPAR